MTKAERESDPAMHRHLVFGRSHEDEEDAELNRKDRLELDQCETVQYILNVI